MNPFRTISLIAVVAALALTGCEAGQAATTSEPAETTTPAATETATPVATDAPEGTVYGDGVSQAETIKISALLADPDSYEGKQVRVEGLVTDVCEKRGCWFKVSEEESFKSLKFKVTDGVMVFPMSAKGKWAVAEGTVQKIPLDLEQTRKVLGHEAEEQKRPFDPESVTEPMVMVRLNGLGAVIRDQR